MTTTTPNMSLIEPDVLYTPSPTWASLLNNALTTIDSHDHSTCLLYTSDAADE